MGSTTAQFRRALVAWVALAGMLVMSAGPLALGHPTFDTDCIPSVSAGHDHAAHRMGAAPEADATGHCLACHLTRSARGAMAPDAIAAGSASPVRVIAHADASPRAVDLRAEFTRGPPSRL